MKSLIKTVLSVTLILFLLSKCDDGEYRNTALLYSGTDTIMELISVNKKFAAVLPAAIRRDSVGIIINGHDYGVLNFMDSLMVDGYSVVLKNFTGIPIVFINTVNAQGIMDKENYIKGRISIDGNTIYPFFSDSFTIKGRGNSTWFFPKKPYKFKLDSKQVLMGMPVEKEFALLANYLDKTLLRNDLGFEISERLGMKWTPKRRFVELILNGEYQGQYLLTETIKTGKDRLNITLMDPKKKNDLTGSFVIEADNKRTNLQVWKSYDIDFGMKDPDSVNANQLSHITHWVDSLRYRINNYLNPLEMVNIDDWIKWTIVNELLRSVDANMGGSCYFYRDSTMKMSLGPVWDMDLSGGNTTGQSPEGWYVNDASMIQGLFKYNQPFRARYKEIWMRYRDTLSSLPIYILNQSTALSLSSMENYRRWSNLTTQDFPTQVTHGGYNEEVDALQQFIVKRYLWMDSTISNL